MNLIQCVAKVPSHWKSQSRIFGEACEFWVEANVPCFKCGGHLQKLKANEKSIDHRCQNCGEKYQVKTGTKNIINKSKKIKITGAEYKTTLSKIGDWSLIVMQYDPKSCSLLEHKFVDKKYITSNCIIPRKPLGPNARRAGWQGCYMIFDNFS